MTFWNICYPFWNHAYNGNSPVGCAVGQHQKANEGGSKQFGAQRLLYISWAAAHAVATITTRSNKHVIYSCWFATSQNRKKRTILVRRVVVDRKLHSWNPKFFLRQFYCPMNISFARSFGENQMKIQISNWGAGIFSASAWLHGTSYDPVNPHTAVPAAHFHSAAPAMLGNKHASRLQSLPMI